MKQYLVTLFDTRSTQENPVKPETLVISESQLSDWIPQIVDANHFIQLGLINTVDSLVDSCDD